MDFKKTQGLIRFQNVQDTIKKLLGTLESEKPKQFSR